MPPNPEGAWTGPGIYVIESAEKTPKAIDLQDTKVITADRKDGDESQQWQIAYAGKTAAETKASEDDSEPPVPEFFLFNVDTGTFLMRDGDSITGNQAKPKDPKARWILDSPKSDEYYVFYQNDGNKKKALKWDADSEDVSVEEYSPKEVPEDHLGHRWYITAAKD